AARLQVHERLNDQVGAALVGILKPSALVVVMDAVHLCMTARGVKKSKSRCVTTFSHGETGSLISLIGNRR
ncbi:MAG: GTP cyclohydrolase I, partial [Deltaproteobacteria bacterium]|nr:GTP cyclohydrolase I [Deltaproteobacteria bacterium]